MGRKAKFKTLKKSKTEFFGFIEDNIDNCDAVVNGIYDEDHRNQMLENDEIGVEEYGFMFGWEDAWDEAFAE